MTSEMFLTPGTKLDKYILLRQIGSGNFGTVWLAHDTNIDRYFAVKVQPLSNGALDDILQEARIGNNHEHKYLVKVHSADKIRYKGKALLLIAMDYYPNGSITNKLNKMEFIPLNNGIRYLIDVLKGLEYLHGNDLYHNDIKPQNILISEGDEGVLTDYGISRRAPNLVPVQPRNVYILHNAPETITDNKISIQTDIYQFGMTVFRLLNGVNKLDNLYKIEGRREYEDLILQGKVIQSVGYCPFIPHNLKKIIAKATHVDPSHRYQTALEMRRALEKLNYPGYWTCDSEGKLLGYNGKNTYYFSSEPREKDRYNLFAKKRVNSGRETNINRYSQKGVDLNKIENLKQKFMLFVVTGEN